MNGSAENPYSTLIGLMRQTAAGTAPKGWSPGTVVSASPLRVRYAGVVLEAAQINLLKDALLAPNDPVAVLPNAAGTLFLVIPID